MTEGLTFRERRLLRVQQSTGTSGRAQAINQAQAYHNSSAVEEEDKEPMAFSSTMRDWLTKDELEGFLRVVDAPPHKEPSLMIDLEEITVGTVQALVGLPVEGLYSIENPSSKILIEYFREYSITSKA